VGGIRQLSVKQQVDEEGGDSTRNSSHEPQQRSAQQRPEAGARIHSSFIPLVDPTVPDRPHMQARSMIQSHFDGVSFAAC
jgi:hypothetical protein